MRWAFMLVLVLAATQARGEEVLARRVLPAGTVLAAADLQPAGSGAVSLAARDAMLGLETRRAIYAGQRVAPADLGPPTLVRRNDLVTMHFVGGGLEIRAEGRALEGGGKGEQIRVMNLASRQAITARVSASAVVEIRR